MTFVPTWPVIAMNERDAIELGIGNSGNEVRRARPARGHADARLAGAAGDALSGETAALLVSREDGSEPVGKAGECLVERHARTARVGENRVDAETVAIGSGQGSEVGVRTRRGWMGPGSGPVRA
jgi:hypothetical protein